MTACPAEQQSQHPASPGPVASAEDVCRGAYKPNHTNASGAKSAMIKVGDLARGELSVWRLNRDPAFDADAVALQIRDGPPGGELFRILAASVGAIRTAQVSHDKIPEGSRISASSTTARPTTTEAPIRNTRRSHWSRSKA